MLIKRIAYSLVVLLSLFACLAAYDLPTPAPTMIATPSPHVHWVTYDQNDVLLDNHITALALAPDGDLWVGTWESLYRYDGETWTSYITDDDIPGNNGVYALAIAPDGTLWASTTARGTKYGISKFDGETWTTYSVLDGLGGPYVRDIAIAPNGTVWAGTWGGLSRFNGETWITYTADDGLIDEHIIDVAIDPTGAVWIGTEAGVSYFNGKTWTTYLAGKNVNALGVTSDGSIWIGTYEYITRFDGKTWITYPEFDAKINRVSCIVKGLDGTLWIGTMTYIGRHSAWPDTGGLYRAETSGDEPWTVYTIEDGLASDTVLAVAVTPGGTVWVGTTKGLSRYTPPDSNDSHAK